MGWRYALAGFLAWLAVVSAVALGGYVPAVTVWGDTPASPRFDGGRIGPGSLVPLDPALAARLLGGPSRSLEAASATGLPRNARPSEPLAPLEALERSQRVMVVHGLVNDDRGNPYVIESIPFTAHTDTRFAGRQAGEPRDCSADGGTTWYAYTPPKDRTLLVSTTGSDHATALGVFDEGGVVACDVDPGGDAKVTIAARGGKRYLFQVTGPLGGGLLTFHVDGLDPVRRLGESSAAWSLGGPSISADGARTVYLSSAGLRLYDARTGGSRSIVRAWDGGTPDGDIAHPRISADGRWVVFSSRATNLVRGDSNREEDVFVHGIDTGETTRVSITSEGAEGWPNSPAVPEDGDVRFSHQAQAISADGSAVVFTTPLQLAGPLPRCSSIGLHVALPYDASLPRAGAPLGVRAYDCRALYLHDRATRATVRISTEHIGAVNPGAVAISDDGRHVAFAADSASTGLRDVFVHDRRLNRTELVSVAADGGRANGHSTATDFPRSLAMSADARWVAFTSLASNLVAGDANRREDVFLRDRATGTTTRLSRQLDATTEPQTDSWFVTVAISADGRFAAYDTPTNDAADGASYLSSCNVDNAPFRIVRVHDIVRNTSIVVPVAVDATRANGGSFGPSLSGRGDALVLMSWATNLEAGQEEPCPDARLGTSEGAWVFLIDKNTRR